MSESVSEVSSIDHEELQDVVPGDVVAVQIRSAESHRTTNQSFNELLARGPDKTSWWVFAGEVRAIESWDHIDPVEEVVDDRPPHKLDSLAKIHVDPQVLWRIDSDAVVDRSRNVTDVPPIKSSSIAPEDGPPPCILDYRSDHRIRLVVFEAQADREDLWHVHRSLGTVVKATHGDMVDPADVLPPGYGPPE